MTTSPHPMAEEFFLRCRELRYSHVSASGSNVCALRGVSIDLYRGQFLTCVGASGAGKSTMLNIVARLLEPSAGEVSYSEQISKPRVGYVFQSNSLFPFRTVRGNLSYRFEIEGLRRE